MSLSKIFFGNLEFPSRAIVLTAAALGLSVIPALGQNNYSNSGNNTNGFVDMFSTGTITSNGSDLVVSTGGSWDTIPDTVTGNFQISFQVYNDSYDGDSHILLLNPGTNGGIDVRNSPQGTDTPSINIFSGTDFTNYDQFFFPLPAATLATASSQKFPNLTWTTIVITLQGMILTDNVGGQIIQTNISGLNLSSTLQVAIGGYATTYNPAPGHYTPLPGELLYRNIQITPEPSSASLTLASGLVAVIIHFRKYGFTAQKSRRPTSRFDGGDFKSRVA